MARRLGIGLFCFLLLAAGAGPPRARAGGPRRAPSDATLAQLSRHAGFIFRGRVLSVERSKPRHGTVTTVQITFEVVEGIRGVRTGERLTIQEWAGLWGAGQPRYHPGQELLLFLYPRSRLGLTSPVGGELGVFPIDAQEQVAAAPHDGGGARRLERPGPAGQPPRVPYRQFSERVRRALGE